MVNLPPNLMCLLQNLEAMRFKKRGRQFECKILNTVVDNDARRLIMRSLIY